MIVCLFIAGAVMALGLSGIFSGSETGLYCLDRLHLRLRSEEGDRRARRLLRIVANEQNALTTFLIGTNVSNYAATAAVVHLLATAAGIGAGRTEVYATIIVTPVILVFGEIVPKNLFQRHADDLMYRVGFLLRVSSVVCAPLAIGFGWLAGPIKAIFDPAGLGASADPRRGIAVLLQDAIAVEDSHGKQSELIDRVLSLPSVALHQVMVPRNRVVAMSQDAGYKAFLSVARRHPYSRLLVHERNHRRIVGYVEVHTLLADSAWKHVRERLRSIISLDPHESVASAIVTLQKSRETIAAVTDRGGYLLGVVTLKDLLEELTGELHEW